MADDLQFKVKVSADTVGLQQTEAALRDVAAAAKEAAKEGNLYTDEQKKAAQALADSLPPLKKTVAEADNLNKTLGGTKQAVSGLGNVLSGIFTGDVLQAGKGLLDLEKAAAAATGGMKAFLASVASGAAIGAALAAPILVAIYKWKKEAEAADKEMQEIWANQGKSTRALAEQQEAATQQMLKNNAAIAESYRKVTSEIDETTRHTAALNAEKTKQALAGAGTPEDKRRIQEAAAIAAADLELSAADQQQRAAVALGEQGDIDRANRALALAQERRRTVSVEQGAGAAARNQALSSQRSVLAARAGEQQAAGDFAGQAATVAEIRKLDASLKANGNAVAGAVAGVTKTVEKNTEKTKATRESGGGN